MSKLAAPGIRSWQAVTIGVADLESAIHFWQDTLGFEVLESREGDDSELAASWQLAAGQICRQALLGVGDARVGRAHLVEFTQTPQSVRANAATYDLCPKNLDIYARDLGQRVQAMKQAGYQFRTEEYAEVSAPDGTRFREIHMPGHDDINFVLLEVLGKSMPFNAQNFYGIGPLIIIVPDVDAEKQFFASLGLEKLAENVLAGPEVEKMIGLPPGVSLDVSIWGDPNEPRAEIEIISYVGATGKDLYPLTAPPACGVIEVHYQVDNLESFAAGLEANHTGFEHMPARITLPGRGESMRIASPAGQRVVVWG